MKSYKAKNKRIIQRDSGGKFRKSKPSDIIPGSEWNDTTYKCSCGNKWTPLLKSDNPVTKCPVCKSETIEMKLEIIPDNLKKDWDDYVKFIKQDFINPRVLREMSNQIWKWENSFRNAGINIKKALKERNR